MSVTTAYMYSVGDVPKMFEAIQKGQVPPRFTNQYLNTLGFKSSNDRAFIPVLKGLGFLDGPSSTTCGAVTVALRAAAHPHPSSPYPYRLPSTFVTQALDTPTRLAKQARVRDGFSMSSRRNSSARSAAVGRSLALARRGWSASSGKNSSFREKNQVRKIDGLGS